MRIFLCGKVSYLCLGVICLVNCLPWITVQWFEGRDYETKKRVAKLITEAVCEGSGCPSSAVSVVFQDVSKRDWAHDGEMYAED